MKKITQRLGILILSLLLLSSCGYHCVGYAVLRSGRGDLYVPFAYTMPLDAGYLGADGARSQLPLIVLEADRYGRTLCSLSFQYYPNDFFENGEAYCIVQRATDTETSFYEDFCCAGVANPDDAEPVIAQLKRDNDWDQPLNEAKMTTLPYQGLDPAGVYTITVEDTDLIDAALDFLKLDSYGCYYEIICKDAYGRVMISLSYPKTTHEVYLLIMRNGEVLNGDVSVLKVQNMASPWEEIHTLKLENQWNLP